MKTSSFTRPKRSALRVLAGMLLAGAILAFFFPVFARARAYSGPNAPGIASGVASHLERYYRDRPGEAVAAWISGNSAPTWAEPEHSSIGPNRWSVLSRRLEANDAKLEIAPGTVGRRWAQIGPGEEVLLVRSSRAGTLRAWSVDKTGRSTPR